MPSMTFSSWTKSTSQPLTSPSVAPEADAATKTTTTGPNSPVESSDKDKDNALSLSYTYPSLASLKDQRAYEHDRQQAKRAADVAKMRARKGDHWASAWYHRDSKRNISNSASLNSEKSKRLRPEEVDALDGVITQVPISGTSGGAAAGRLGGDVLDNSRVSASESKPEVKLADLISSRRKPRKNKDTDFEVVPHVRSVIVLDDFVSRDVPVDEPWEHVYHSDTDEESTSDKYPTYASIVSK